MRAVTSSSATRCAQVIVQAERGARNGKVAAPPLQAGKPDKRDPARATVGQSNAPKLNMFTRDYFGYQWSVAPLTSGKRRACLPVPGWLHVGSDAPARLLLPRCPQRCWTHLQGGWWTTPCCWSARCGMCRGRRGAPADSAPQAGQQQQLQQAVPVGDWGGEKRFSALRVCSVDSGGASAGGARRVPASGGCRLCTVCAAWGQASALSFPSCLFSPVLQSLLFSAVQEGGGGAGNTPHAARALAHARTRGASVGGHMSALLCSLATRRARAHCV